MDDIRDNQWIRVGRGPLIASNPSKRVPKVDPGISQIVGRKVFTHDPNLVKMVMKHKAKGESEKPDDFLKSPEFIKELKETFK